MWKSFYRNFITDEGYKTVLQGLQNTLIIAIFGLCMGILLGALVACFQVAGKRNKVAHAISYVGDLYVALFRGTPIIVQIFVFHFVIFPMLGSTLSGLWDCCIVFGLNSGAYVSEIMRGGILSVDIGQTEAGRTLGLSYTTTMFRVVIPQAIKNVIPTLGNEFITLTKDTSVAGYASIMDLTFAFRSLSDGGTNVMAPYIVLALCYLVLIAFFTVIIRMVERRLRKSERR